MGDAFTIVGEFHFGLVYQNQLQTTLHYIYRIVAEIELLKMDSPFPLRQHETSARLFSQAAKKTVPPLLLPNAFPKQVRYNGPPDAEEYLSPKDV